MPPGRAHHAFAREAQPQQIGIRLAVRGQCLRLHAVARPAFQNPAYQPARHAADFQRPLVPAWRAHHPGRPDPRAAQRQPAHSYRRAVRRQRCAAQAVGGVPLPRVAVHIGIKTCRLQQMRVRSAQVAAHVQRVSEFECYDHGLPIKMS